jgi:hypothetical protein
LLGIMQILSYLTMGASSNDKVQHNAISAHRASPSSETIDSGSASLQLICKCQCKQGIQ